LSRAAQPLHIIRAMSYSYMGRRTRSLLLIVFWGVLGCQTTGLLLEPEDAGTSDDAAISDDLRTGSSLRCQGKATPALGTTMRTVMSRGQKRTFFLHIPPAYDPSRGIPLVLAFHGLSDKAADFIKYIDIEREADAQNVVFIAPQGLGVVPGWNAGNCCGEPQLFGIDDVGFARDLIDLARRELCIDEGRIYAMGFSNGGMFSHRLGCELSSVLAAIGPVSGTPMVKECKPERAISILAFHGTSDPVVGYEGGGTGTFPKVPEVFADWARRDRCSDSPHQTFQHGAVTCQTYEKCADGTIDSLCTIDKGTHAWPGAANGTKDIRATAEILRFFAQHAR